MPEANHTLTVPGPLVGADWLASHRENPALRILDGSWYLPTQDRDPAAEFAACHIPGAVFFDIDAIADPASNLPHMLPGEAGFAAAVGALGISNDNAIVVYDGAGVFSAPRVWWTFRTFGHDNIAVLQGGLPAWRSAGHPVTDEMTPLEPAQFAARLKPGLVRNADQIRANIENPTEQVVDARAEGRFHGRDPEPRPGLRGGHIPGSFNLPHAALVDADAGTLQDPATIRARLEKAGVSLDRPITTTCGSGISAALLALAFYTAGHTETAVYDGSWTEWGGLEDAPIA